MPMKDETLLGTGLIAIILSILIGRFVYWEAGGFSLSSFASGVLCGAGVVLVLSYLLKRRRG